MTALRTETEGRQRAEAQSAQLRQQFDESVRQNKALKANVSQLKNKFQQIRADGGNRGLFD